MEHLLAFLRFLDLGLGQIPRIVKTRCNFSLIRVKINVMSGSWLVKRQLGWQPGSQPCSKKNGDSPVDSWTLAL